MAVSGLHAGPEFRLIGPDSGRPVFFDDTCYLLPFNDPVDAAIAHAVLTSTSVQRFLQSIKCPGAKRPITKKLLPRIDLAHAVQMTEPSDLLERAQARVASVHEHALQRFLRSTLEPQGALTISR